MNQTENLLVGDLILIIFKQNNYFQQKKSGETSI